MHAAYCSSVNMFNLCVQEQNRQVGLSRKVGLHLEYMGRFEGIRSSLHSLRSGQLLRCAHKRIANIFKVYIERNNMQVELIRFRKTYRLYSRLLLRSEE